MRKIESIYADLAPVDQADLAFKAVCAKDEATFKKIASSLHTKSYRMPDNRYQSRIDVLGHIGMTWLVEYWRLQASYFSALLNYRKTKGVDHSVADEAFEQAQLFSQMLIAHHLLIDGLGENGVDRQDMLSFCGVDEAEIEGSYSKLIEEARVYYDNWLAFYKSLLDGVDAKPEVYKFLGLHD